MVTGMLWCMVYGMVWYGGQRISFLRDSQSRDHVIRDIITRIPKSTVSSECFSQNQSKFGSVGRCDCNMSKVSKLIFRPWLRRAAWTGATAAVVVAAFPHVEDAYWLRKDPRRMIESHESTISNETTTTSTDTTSASSSNEKKNLVILGTGWASVSLLKHIDRDKYNITVVSPRNYFLFTPLLPVSTSQTEISKAITIRYSQVNAFLLASHLCLTFFYF